MTARLVLPWALPNPGEADQAAIQQFRDPLRVIMKKFLPPNSRGLIGRNAVWGEMFSPRFQMGAGQSLRIALALYDIKSAAAAYRALEAGTQSIHADGYVTARLPARMRGGKPLSERDVSRAAAFYLSDACTALLALENHHRANQVAPFKRRAKVMEAMRRALNWLMAGRGTLLQADDRAPNRLLIDALAFHACGELNQHTAAVDTAGMFVKRALALWRKGYFVEKSGWDTSYQAVAVHAANTLLASGYRDSRLAVIVYHSANWLSMRIDKQGRVNSKGNTRTCGGGESFLGRTKKLAVHEVFLALSYTATREHDEVMADAAQRLYTWAGRHRKSDPCFEFE